MREEVDLQSDIKYIRNVVVTNEGEAKTYYIPYHIVRSEEFELPIILPKKFDYFTALFYYDFTEVLLIVIAWFLNYLFIYPMADVSIWSSNMIVFWGIFSLIMTAGRHAFWGPGHYAAKVNLVHKKLLEGKFVSDFKLIGMLTSIFLIFFSTKVESFFIFLFNPF